MSEKQFDFEVTQDLRFGEKYGILIMCNFMKQEVTYPIPEEFLNCEENSKNIYTRIILHLFEIVNWHIGYCHYNNRNTSPVDIFNEKKNNPQFKETIVNDIYVYLLKNNKNFVYNRYLVEKMSNETRNFLHNVVTCFLNHFEIEV